MSELELISAEDINIQVRYKGKQIESCGCRMIFKIERKLI